MKGIKNLLIVCAVIIVTLEISPWIIGRFFLHQSFSRSEIKKELLSSEVLVDSAGNENNTTDGYLGDHILHPYLGFVSIPHSNYNEFNLPGTNPIIKKAPGKLNVVIMGGSVAKDIYSHTGKRIIENLKKSNVFAGKEINLVVFALGGFKQPQPLIALNYFMALGAEYDIVINIDGFNEIVLPYADNLPHHVFPSYPRHWNIYSRKKLDSRVILVMGKQAVLNERIKNNKEFLSQSFLRYSNFSLFVWKLSDLKLKSKIAGEESQLRTVLENSESDYQSTGPYTTISDTLTFFREQAEFWMKSSKQISLLSRAGEFEYFHFLQPNQYDKGSKELNEEEMNIAFEPGPFAYKDAAAAGYPLLREQGKLLVSQGVNFTDLSMLFRAEKRTVYNDKCCHFNLLGYEMIADKICSEIVMKYTAGIQVNENLFGYKGGITDTNQLPPLAGPAKFQYTKTNKITYQ